MRRAQLSLQVLLLLAIVGCSPKQSVNCPQLGCKVECGPAGTRKDDRTGCRTCLCAGGALDGGSCPALSCSQTCGSEGYAVEPTTGCPTCSCCFPADCQPGGCNGTGADGCPTCRPCS